MIYGRVPVAEAEGLMLAHALRLPDRAGKRGALFKKGRVLSAADIAAMREAAVAEVLGVRLEPDDVGEDAAAAALAAAAAGAHLTATAAFTGRCNLLSGAHGIATIDRARVDAFNAVDEAVTIATLLPYEPVEPRQMVATIKVIPFAVPRRVLDRCVALASQGGPLLGVAPFRSTAVALIQTRLPSVKVSVLDGTAEVIRARLEALASRLVGETRCDHDEAALAAAIGAAAGTGAEMVLVAGASAIVDRHDVIPAALERAGGTVKHFGMPVDPGNLLLLGHLDRGAARVPVLGLPGCARSPKLNGFDWVLQRLIARVAVTRSDIMAMGAGGLLKEIPTRPLPRAEAIRGAATPAPAPLAPRAPRIAALVLAAGMSRRMGTTNKLLVDVAGEPMVARVIAAVRASQARPIIVVTGHEPERVRAALAGPDLRFVHNPDYAAGLSGSLKAGLAALPDDCDGVLVCLGDMPRVTAADLDKLIAAFNPTEGRAICVPTYRSKRGNPVLWGRRLFAAMQGVAGDVGAKHLIGEHADLVCEVPIGHDGVLLDIDTPQALAQLAARSRETA